MKLLLLSSSLGAVPDFLPPQSHIGLIPTAASLDTNPWYVDRDRQQLLQLGHHVTYIDLNPLSTIEINARLDAIDALYVTGGNAFYLMQQLRRKNVADTLADRIHHGLPYLGSGAGAVILGPSLEPHITLDDPAAAPYLTTHNGLAVVPFVPLPHYGTAKYQPRHNDVLAQPNQPHHLMPFRDDQALLITDSGTLQLISSPMLALHP